MPGRISEGTRSVNARFPACPVTWTIAMLASLPASPPPPGPHASARGPMGRLRLSLNATLGHLRSPALPLRLPAGVSRWGHGFLRRNPPRRCSGARHEAGVGSREGLRALGEGEFQLHGPGEASPEEPARRLVSRGEAPLACGCRLEIALGDAQVGGKPCQAYPGLREKSREVESRHETVPPAQDRATKRRAAAERTPFVGPKAIPPWGRMSGRSGLPRPAEAFVLRCGRGENFPWHRARGRPIMICDCASFQRGGARSLAGRRSRYPWDGMLPEVVERRDA